MANQANQTNQLAVVDTKELRVVPGAEELAAITEELGDMGAMPFGKVQIAAAGAGVFKVTEPGEDEATPATEITAVIIHSHRANVLWLAKFGSGEDRTPDCFSLNGAEGVDRDNGELHPCAHCQYNQYGSADGGTGRGKACKNTRRLYLLRPAQSDQPGDVLPLILTLPSTALATYDKYRTRLLLARHKPWGVVTRITLKNAVNKDGIAYSTPLFQAVAALPPQEAERVRQYAEGFVAAMNGQALGRERMDPVDSYADDEPLPFE